MGCPRPPRCGEGVGRAVSRLRLRTVVLLASGEGEQARGKDESGGDPGAGFGNGQGPWTGGVAGDHQGPETGLAIGSHPSGMKEAVEPGLCRGCARTLPEESVNGGHQVFQWVFVGGRGGDPGVEAEVFLGFEGDGADDEGGDVAQVRGGLKVFHEGESIHHGHDQVDDDEGRGVLLEDFEGLASVGSGLDAPAIEF